MLFALVLTALSQTEPANVVLTDLGLHVIGVGYQRTVSPRIALQADLELYTPWTQNINFLGLSGDANRGDATGYAIRARPFFYLLKDAPRGLWLSPFAQVGIANQSFENTRVWGPVAALGASVGWAWLPFDRLSIVVGLGGQFHATFFTQGARFARFYPTIDGSLGWAF